MKHSIKVIIAAVCLCALLAGCGSVSLLIPEESETKSEFNQEEFDREFYRTSVPEETESEAQTSETETQAESQPESTATTSAETSSVKPSETVKETSAAPSSTSPEKTTKQGITLTTKPSTTQKYVVDTKIETKETKSDYKYGVKKIDVVSTYYDIYNDGSKVKTDEKSYVKYDTSGFKASTSDLLSEAKSNKSSHSSDIRSAVNKVNGYRTSAGKAELTMSDDLCTAASVRATEMAYSGKLSSTRPAGTNYASVLKDLGIEYTNCIELTCKGYTSGEEAMEALKSKTQNLSLMTSGDYKKVGVGVAQSPDGMWYWSIIFTD